MGPRTSAPRLAQGFEGPCSAQDGPPLRELSDRSTCGCSRLMCTVANSVKACRNPASAQEEPTEGGGHRQVPLHAK